MAEGNTGNNTMLGVLLGAVIVIVVGGGILYATGVVGGAKTPTVNVSVPQAAAPAAPPQNQANAPDHRRDDHHNGFDRRDDHRPGGDRDRHSENDRDRH
jgi:hypothetical protein